jgi:uncharacterized iron-regulated protein
MKSSSIWVKVSAFLIVLLAAALSGCITTSSSNSSEGLAGKIYDSTNGVFLSDDQYLQSIKATDFLLLGEIHDNPTHHQLQAEAIKKLQLAGQHVKVYFEHLNTSQNEKINQFNQKLISIDRLAAELDWDKSGWPEFKIFQPLFEQALKHNVEISAALFPKDKIKSLYREGMKAVIDQATLDAKNLEELPASSKDALLEDIVASHCGMVTKEKGEPMVKVQMGKDAFMAMQLTAGEDKKIVFVAGNGHIRKDYGVPLYLKKLSPNKKVVSVAMVEVTDEKESLQNYLSANSADILIFTTPWPRKDPCEEMRKFMKK